MRHLFYTVSAINLNKRAWFEFEESRLRFTEIKPSVDTENFVLVLHGEERVLKKLFERSALLPASAFSVIFDA